MSYASLSGIARTGLGVLLAGVLVLLGPTSQALGVRSEDEPARPQAAAGQESQTDQQAAGEDAQASDSQAQADAAPLKKDTTVRISKPDGTVVVKSGGSTWLRPGAKAPKAIRVTGSSSTGARSVGSASAPNRLHSPKGAARRALGTAEAAATPSSGAVARTSSPTRGTVKVPANSVLLTAGRGGSGRSTGGGVGGGVVAGDEADTWLTGRGWVPGDDSGDDGAYISPLMSEGFPVLEPGTGWAGDTAEPPSVGNPDDAGFDAKAIARWDVVPYQTITDDFTIGVVAFHINGIDRVDFSLNGGPWVSVREMQLNPRTNVWEYTAVLRPSLLAQDGLVEVRAIAWPKGAGEPRVLAGEYDFTRTYQGSEWTGEHSLFLTADPSGKLDEQVIELPPGEYVWGEAPLYFGSQADPSRWLTYRPAAGVSSDEVVIVGSTDLVPKQRDFKKIRLQNLTMLSANLAWFNNQDDQMMWLDGVTVAGTGQWTCNTGFPQFHHQFWTNCTVHDMRSGQAKHFVRNCTFYKIGEDVIRESYLVINVTVDNVDAGNTSWHSGVIANPLVHDNRIYCNILMTNIVNAVAWPMRNGTNTYWENHDIAIVNCATTGITPESHVWYVGADTRHLIVDNCTFQGLLLWRTANDIPEYWKFKAHNVQFTNTVINGDPAERPSPDPFDGVTFIETRSDHQ